MYSQRCSNMHGISNQLHLQSTRFQFMVSSFAKFAVSFSSWKTPPCLGYPRGIFETFWDETARFVLEIVLRRHFSVPWAILRSQSLSALYRVDVWQIVMSHWLWLYSSESQFDVTFLVQAPWWFFFPTMVGQCSFWPELLREVYVPRLSL